MKTQYNILKAAAAVVAAAAIAAGCVKENLAEKAGQRPLDKDGYRISLTVCGEPQTRTTITQSDTTLPVKWKSGDKLYVVGQDDGYIGSLEMDDETGVGAGSATFSGVMSSAWKTSSQVLHVYYLGEAEPTIDKDSLFTFDISTQYGCLDSIAASGHIAHLATEPLDPGAVTVTGTLGNMNAVIMYDLSEWTSGVEITGTYNRAILNLKRAAFDTTGCAGSISLPDSVCKSSTYVTFIPASKALTFKKGGASTPTRVNTLAAGRFYSDEGKAIKIPAIYVGSEGGLLPGKFSVSATYQVQFSKGNLQYQASTNTWRFADNQYDYVGDSSNGNVYEGGVKCDNANISSSYSGWIDFFGWGTSGQDHGAICYQPWSVQTGSTNYHAYNNNKANLTDYPGTADWGYNAISNGGNTVNSGWCSLSCAEWKYLLDTRKVTVGGTKKYPYGHGVVNGVNGLIILPDNWNGTVCTGFTYGDCAWASNNNFSESTTPKWSDMEAAGAVFLPASGHRNGSSIVAVVSNGHYWTSSVHSDYSNALDMQFQSENHNPDLEHSRHYGKSVRLVKYVNDKGGYTEDGWGYGPGIEVNGVIWAPVNCGVGAKYAYPYGKLYQWGRKDGQGYYHGTYSPTETTPTINEVFQGSNGVYTGTYPLSATTFYKNGTSGMTYDLDWIKNGSNDYWNKAVDPNDASQEGKINPIKGDFDPCPAGWRLPTYYELNALFGDNIKGWASVGGQNGFYYNGTNNCTSSTSGAKVFLPAAGSRSRSTGNTINRTTQGYYWSSSVNSANARSLNFSSNNGSMVDEERAEGFSVRCVYDASTSGVTAGSFDDRSSW